MAANCAEIAPKRVGYQRRLKIDTRDLRAEGIGRRRFWTIGRSNRRT